MTTTYSPSLSPAHWRARPLSKQPSTDNLSSFGPSHSKPSTLPTSPVKSRFSISSVIRFGTKSKKNRAVDIIQDPPDHLYAAPIPMPSISRLQRKESDLNLDSCANPRFSRGVSSTSGTSCASTDGPLTPSDDPRVSYQHSMMSLSESVNPFSLSSKSISTNQIALPPNYVDDKRYSAQSDKSLGRRIKERLNGDRDGNRTVSFTSSGNKVSKTPDLFIPTPPLGAKRNDKHHVRERSLTLPPSRVRSGVLADISSDKPFLPAEANDQAKLNTPPLSPIAFQHPFVMAEAIPATLLDAHASAHPRKMSDSTYFSRSSFGTTMSSLSRTPTVLSTSTSKSAPAPGFNSVIKSRFTRGSAGVHSSIPPLSAHSSMSSLRTSVSQANLKRPAPVSILNQSSSSSSVSPRTDSPHPPPTTSLPPTPAETGSDAPPDIRSLSSSVRRVPLDSALVSNSQTPNLNQTSSGNQHLTPTLKPIASGSSVSLSTISSLSFAVRPSTYGGSNDGSRSRSASRSGSVSASVPEREQEDNSRRNGLNKTGPRELTSMIDMTGDSENEESEIEFGDEEDILRNTNAFSGLPPQRSNTSNSNFSRLGIQGSASSPSFVHPLVSSTVPVLRKQCSFHHTIGGSSNVPDNSMSASASTSPHTSSTSPLSASSPVNTSSNPSSEANSLSRSHPFTSRSSHPSSSATHHNSNQVQNHNPSLSYTPSQLQLQQQHQSQAQRHVRALRHHNSFDPGMSGNGGTNAKLASSSSISNSAGGVNDITTGANVGMYTDILNGAGKFGTVRAIAVNGANGTPVSSGGISSNPPARTTSPPASLRRNPTGRSPATSIHSLQLQIQFSEETNQAPQSPATHLSSTIASSPPSEKRKLLGSRREREKKTEFGLPTVAEPSDNIHYPFPTHVGNHGVPCSKDDKADDNAAMVAMRSLSPKIDLGRPILTPEDLSRIGEEDTLSSRRRAKSSWGSNTTSIANTYISADPAFSHSASRYHVPGSIRHAISSSDLYNSANLGDGLRVVVRNEFNDGDPDFTSLPAPPRKSKSSAFSNSSGVNSLGIETGRSRGRKDSKEKKEKKDRDKSRKRSRSKSKSKPKGDETGLDDTEPSFLDMGSGGNVILTFEGDKEVVWDDEPISTIGLPPKPRASGGRHHDRPDYLHHTEPVQSTNYGYEYRHPYGYTEQPYTPSSLMTSSHSSLSPALSALPPYGPDEDSFLELSRGHDSVCLTKDDLRFLGSAM